MLADPTRRRILDLLADRGPLTVGQLACEFPELVPSGISKHLMGLRAAGLVAATRQGRHQLYELQAETFSHALLPWLARYERHWSESLERLRDLAEGSVPAVPSISSASEEPHQPAKEKKWTPQPTGSHRRRCPSTS